jgi:phosphoribosylamine--glycine ligase
VNRSYSISVSISFLSAVAINSSRKSVLILGDTKTVLPFHAGTKILNGKLVTNGGRVIALTGLGKNLGEALSKSYSCGEQVQWEGKNFRSDIGFDLKGLGQ